jgi:hypothetical protein
MCGFMTARPTGDIGDVSGERFVVATGEALDWRTAH